MSVTVISFPSDGQSVYDDGVSSQPNTGLSQEGTQNRDKRLPLSQSQHHRSWLNFDAAFPSIIKTAVQLRSARDKDTLESFVAIADVFVMCAKTVIHEVHRSCVGSDPDASYDVAKSTTELVIRLMHGKIKTEPGAVDVVLDLADMVIANLKELTQVALRITREMKPLPAIPTTSEESSGSDDEVSAAENHTSFFDYQLVDSDVHAESYDTARYKFLFGGRLRGLLKSTLSSASSEKLSCSATLVSDDFCRSSISSNTATSKGTPGSIPRNHSDIPYVLRQSALFLQSDTNSLELDVEGTLPTENAKSILFNRAGEVKGASFSALVHMLTSKDAILDPDLVPTFFAGYRIFGSVVLFLEELRRRFDEDAPGNLSTDQLRVWAREAFLTRLRVGKILLLWLTDYWQPVYDNEVLGHLHQFAVERVRNELPRALATPILEMIDSRLTGDEVYVASHKDRYFKILANQIKQTKIIVTGFSYPEAFDSSIDILTLFDTDNGKEEFTQQLTAIVSAMFRKVNPQDVVTYWHKHSDSELGPALSETTSFARSLAMFVTHSIVSQQERTCRCQRIEFWISIATSCLHYRNYFTSHCVFAGITHSAINRLKRTILVDLSKPAKVKFRRLDKFFSGHLNHARVRKAMTEKTAATVPLLVPLKQDVVNIKQVSQAVEPSAEPGDLVNLVPYRVLMKTMRAMESSLIPYGIPKNARFERWLGEVLRGFPADQEEELYNSCYHTSRRIEPRDQELERFSSTWNYFQATKKAIHELPPDEDLSGQHALRKGVTKPFRTLLDALRRESVT